MQTHMKTIEEFLSQQGVVFATVLLFAVAIIFVLIAHKLYGDKPAVKKKVAKVKQKLMWSSVFRSLI